MSELLEGWKEYHKYNGNEAWWEFKLTDHLSIIVEQYGQTDSGTFSLAYDIDVPPIEYRKIYIDRKCISNTLIEAHKLTWIYFSEIGVKAKLKYEEYK